MLDKLIKYLESQKGSIMTDSYNDNTINWSKGFRKGFEYAIKLLKDYKG